MKRGSSTSAGVKLADESDTPTNPPNPVVLLDNCTWTSYNWVNKTMSVLINQLHQ